MVGPLPISTKKYCPSVPCHSKTFPVNDSDKEFKNNADLGRNNFLLNSNANCATPESPALYISISMGSNSRRFADCHLATNDIVA